jgi:hypothetical protein
MAAEMKSTQISEEMAKTSVVELVNQTGFYAKEEKSLKPTHFEEAKMGRRWSETTEDQFQDEKKCTIM